MIAVATIGGGIHVYDIRTGERLWEGKLSPPHNNQLGALWAHDGPLRFATTSSQSDAQVTIDICELARAPGPPLRVIASFPVGPHDGQFSFSPTSYHASFVTGTEIIMLGVQSSKTLFRIEETSPLYTSSGCFSHDGSVFACGTMRKDIYVWKKTPDGYVSRGCLRPLLPFAGFAVSPVATSILGWGPAGLELFALEDFAGVVHTEPLRQEDCIALRRVVAGPGKPRFYLRLPRAYDQ